VVTGERQEVGVGMIEAPRGTLIHHYHVDENDQVIRANLIVSTTHNNQAMNEAVRKVAMQYLDGRKLTEGLLNHIEVAVRAFDPCLSCATHALGKMPLQVELIDAESHTSTPRRLPASRPASPLTACRPRPCSVPTRPTMVQSRQRPGYWRSGATPLNWARR
jgi:hypothetical protein